MLGKLSQPQHCVLHIALRHNIAVATAGPSACHAITDKPGSGAIKHSRSAGDERGWGPSHSETLPQIIGNSSYFLGQTVYTLQGTAGNIPLAAAFTVVPIVIMGIYLAIAKRMGAFDAL